MAQDKELVNYLIATFHTDRRAKILNTGGIYIWNAEETTILAGPFDSQLHAFDARSKALDEAIKRVNRKQ